jgi:hypothetical protein
MQEGRWTTITPSQFAHEREALSLLAKVFGCEQWRQVGEESAAYAGQARR